MIQQSKDLTIEYDTEYEWYSLYEFGVFPRSSVLAGQVKKVYKGHYDTVEEAVADNPTASVEYRDPHNTFDHLNDYNFAIHGDEYD